MAVILALGLAFWAWGWLQAPVPHLDASSLSLAILSLLADSMAVALPLSSSFSLAPVLLGVLALTGQLRLALLMSVIGPLLNCLLRPRQRRYLAWQMTGRCGALLFFLPVAVWPRIGTLVCYLLWERAWPQIERAPGQERSLWQKCRNWSWPYLASALCTIPLLRLASEQGAAYLWVCFPALAAAARALEAELLRHRIDSEQRSREQSIQQQAELEQARRQLDSSRHELSFKNRAENLVWELSQKLFVCQTLEEVCAAALDTLRNRIHFGTGAVALDGRWIYTSGQFRPDPALQIRRTPYSDVSARIVPLLHGRGCLICGHLEKPFDIGDQAMIDNLGGLLSLAILAVLVQENQRRQLGEMLDASKTAAVGQLSAGFAHELNSPLAAIALQLDLAETRVARPESMLKSVQAARAPLERCRHLIARLLYYSRDGTMGGGPVRLTEVLQDVCSFIQSDYARQGLRILTDLRETGSFQGQPSEIQQLLVNLLDNARLAMEGRGGDIRLSTEDAGNRIVLKVVDQGPGLPEEVARRMFEPFFTTRQPGSGVGLGLTVAQNIAQRHGGSLSGRSLPSGGAEFRAEFPRDC